MLQPSRASTRLLASILDKAFMSFIRGTQLVADRAAVGIEHDARDKSRALGTATASTPRPFGAADLLN